MTSTKCVAHDLTVIWNPDASRLMLILADSEIKQTADLKEEKTRQCQKNSFPNNGSGEKSLFLFLIREYTGVRPMMYDQFKRQLPARR